MVGQNEVEHGYQRIKTSEEIIIDERWKTKRKETFAIFCLQVSSVGMEFTIIQSTLWPYINECMHTSQPKLIYGVICAGRFICPIFFNLFISRWFDVHRRLRLSAIVLTMLVTVGYILYIIQGSPFSPIFGVTLQGFAFVLKVIINSEILRVYKNDEIPGKIIVLMVDYGFGETIGPLIVKLLDKVDFWIGSLHIMYFTMPCLIMLIFSIIKLILMYFFFHDISREHELTANETQAEETGPSEVTISKSWWDKLIGTFGIDAILLLVQQFYTGPQTSLLNPFVMDTLRYNNLAVDLCFIGTSVFITMIFNSK